jgi:TPR repeat protein
MIQPNNIFGDNHMKKGIRFILLAYFKIILVHLMELAISEKVPEAQFALGQIYNEGCPGVNKNESNTMKLFQLAAKQGYEPAKEILKARMKQ